MLKRAFFSLSVITLFFLASYLIFITASASEGTELLAPGHMTAEFPDLKGTPHTLAQWKGKVILVNFWATWCGPCREEIPELSEINQRYKEKGFAVVGISLDDSAKIKDFMKQTSINYQVLVGELDAMPYSLSLGNQSMVVPYTVLLDRKGNIAHAYYGKIKIAEIEEDVLKLLNTTK
jgi:peroxiredoxin